MQAVHNMNSTRMALKTYTCKRTFFFLFIIDELPHDKTNNMNCASSKDSDQPLISLRFCMKKSWVLSYPVSAQQRLIRLGRCGQQRLWMPRLIWVFAGHLCHFDGFVMRWLIFRTIRVCTRLFFSFATTFANLIFFCANFFKFGPFIATFSQVILL